MNLHGRFAKDFGIISNSRKKIKFEIKPCISETTHFYLY